MKCRPARSPPPTRHRPPAARGVGPQNSALARRRQASGFTMVELIVTLMVVGILAAVAVPRFDSLRGWDETAYVERVKASVQYARKSAVAQRRNVRIALANTGITLTVESATPEGSGSPGTYVALALPGSSSNTLAAPAGVTLPGATTTLTFDALGRSAGTTYTIGGTTLTVVAETGYVY